MEDEELRFCFNIDVTEDEFYQNNEVKHPMGNKFHVHNSQAQIEIHLMFT